MNKTLPVLAVVCILGAVLFSGAASAQGPTISGDLFHSFWTLLADGQISPEGVCYVHEDCDAGGSVECSGTTCSAAQEYVECDGQRTYCPCQASLTCYGGTTISCTSAGGSRPGLCDEYSYYISCDEHITYCPVTCTAECLDGLTQCVGYTGPYACFGKANLYISCDGRQYFCTDPVF